MVRSELTILPAKPFNLEKKVSQSGIIFAKCWCTGVLNGQRMKLCALGVLPMKYTALKLGHQVYRILGLCSDCCPISLSQAQLSPTSWWWKVLLATPSPPPLLTR